MCGKKLLNILNMASAFKKALRLFTGLGFKMFQLVAGFMV